MPPSSILWYFADPMCSWCWGFSPVIEQLKSVYDKRLNIALMLGGLRPGTTESMSAQLRDEILHHWYEVHKLTGQSFSFEDALPEGFVYDTEPACRAVITVAQLGKDKIFPYFKSIQSAFYIDQVDVTLTENLATLANQQGFTSDQFLTHFHSDAVIQKTKLQFHGTQQAGVSGFPSLVLQNNTDFQFITRGYRPFDDMSLIIEAWLEQYPD
mgnify:CR=1 FL=1